MKKLTLGQLHELLESAKERLERDPHNETLQNAVQKLQDGIKQERTHPPKRRSCDAP